MFQSLASENYAIVKPLFADLSFNLIISAMIEGTSPGKIYVDDLANPTTCFLSSAEGCYLAGEAHNDSFNADLKQHLFSAFLQDEDYIVLECTSTEWEATLDDIFQGRVVKYPRSYYTFEQMKLDWENEIPNGISVEQVNAAFITRTQLTNMDKVIAAIHSNWNSADEFFKDGFGVCLVNETDVISWCMADCVSGVRCEIGIHTDARFQKRGFASLTVSATVAQALSRGLTEIGWHCWEHNHASNKTAQKVGFQFRRPYEAYLCLANEERHWLEQGLFQERKRNYREAIAWYEKTQSEWAYFLAARCYAPLGEYEEAIKALTQAMALGWNEPDYLKAEQFKPLHELAEWKALPLNLQA
jgi:RimJ/RimL family protein N-acetyltransferase